MKVKKHVTLENLELNKYSKMPWNLIWEVAYTLLESPTEEMDIDPEVGQRGTVLKMFTNFCKLGGFECI